MNECDYHSLTALVCGDGPTLVLFHGGVGSFEHWAKNIPVLAKDFKVIAFDLPGFGLSPDVPKHFSENDYLDWINSELVSRCDGPFNLAAFSFGAVIATAIAAHTDQVRALFLVGPGGFGIPVGRELDLTPPYVGNQQVSAIDEMRFKLSQTMLYSAEKADDETVFIHRRNVLRTRFDSRKFSLSERLVSDLAKTSCPIQIVWGDHDRLAYPSVSARADLCRHANPRVDVRIIEDCGHWAQFESAPKVNRLMLDFFSGVTRHDSIRA